MVRAGDTANVGQRRATSGALGRSPLRGASSEGRLGRCGTWAKREGVIPKARRGWGGAAQVCGPTARLIAQPVEGGIAM
jgi:hypothetical protein